MRPWNTLNADEKKLFSRMAEVYAGFSEYTDAQVGRIIDYLEETGQLDNTIVFYCADNGASGEGSPNGSVNENKFFNGYPDELAENMKLPRQARRAGHLRPLSRPDGRWRSRRRSRCSSATRSTPGGTCDPLVISWPKGIKARARCATSTTTPPTSCRRSSTSAASRCPRSIGRGAVPALRRVDALHASTPSPTRRRRRSASTTRCSARRGIWEDGWKAAAVHAPLTGKGHFDKDQWELYHVDVDRAESKDLAEGASREARRR